MFIKPDVVNFSLPATDIDGNPIDTATLSAKLYVDGIHTAPAGLAYTRTGPTTGQFSGLGNALPDVGGVYVLTVSVVNAAGVESAQSLPANATVVDTNLIPPGAPEITAVS